MSVCVCPAVQMRGPALAERQDVLGGFSPVSVVVLKPPVQFLSCCSVGVIFNLRLNSRLSLHSRLVRLMLSSSELILNVCLLKGSVCGLDIKKILTNLIV